MARPLVLAVVVLCLAWQASAQLVWTGSVNNTWNTTDSNWLSGGVPAVYGDGAAVQFDDTALLATINVASAVSPSGVTFINSTKSYAFTNDVLTGTGSVTKLGNAIVDFGSTNRPYAVSHAFTGGTTINQGALRFRVVTNTTANYAAGGTAYGFGTGLITIDGTNASLGFSTGYGLSGPVVLTNAILIGTNGGTIDFSRPIVTAGSPQNNVSGNIDVYGRFVVTAGNIGTGVSGSVWRVMSGITTLHTATTVTLASATTAFNRGAYQQNITQDATPRPLTLVGFGADSGYVELSGDNSGLTAGVTLRPDASKTSAILFTSTNAMGSGAFNVSSGACAGLAFAFTASKLQGMTFTNGAILGIDSNSDVDIDFSAAGINRDVWLGTARGAIYTGILTPNGSVYRMCGCGTASYNPLVLARTNALTGARSLLVGDRGNVTVPGALALAASNDFSGGTIVSPTSQGASGSKPSPILIGRADGCFGSGSITVLRNTTLIDPTLQFDTVTQTVPNDIIFTGTVANASGALAANVPTRLTGNLTLYASGTSTNALNSTGPSVLILDQAASGHTVTSYGVGRLVQSTGLLDPCSAANLPANLGLYLPTTNATLVLSPTFGWSDLVAGRVWTNTITPTNYQWNGACFAARGTPQTIDNSGSFGAFGGTNWLNALAGMRLGSTLTNADGSWYADAPIRFARDINATKSLTFTIAAQGPGLTNDTGKGIVQELTGTISGTGALVVASSGATTDGLIAELLMSGTNSWSGANIGDYQGSAHPCPGPGGLEICNNDLFIRFASNASLPRGNGGNPAYLMAINRTTSDNRFGFLFTGTTNHEVYTPPAGYALMLGGAGNGITAKPATLGSTGNKATLAGVMIGLWKENATTANTTLNLLVRDTNGVFTLGTDAAPVQFTPCVVNSTTNPAGYVTYPATPVLDCSPTQTNRLIKRGPGTLVIGNVRYLRIDGTTDATGIITWTLGRSTPGVFDGVVRESGTAASNSLRAAVVTMDGAIMGLAADYTPQMGTNAAQLSMAGAAGAGFAAYGARRVVTLAPRGGDYLNWGQTTATNNDFFMNSAGALILNAPDADGEIVLAPAASTNYIRLGTGLREIRVMDNPSLTADSATIAMQISNTSGACSLSKTGPGTLTLSATNNNWGGVAYVSNGTLCVNGSLLGNSSSNVVVASGATLSGTGAVYRPVVVAAGGTITAGTAAGAPGTLTVSNLTLQAGGTFLVTVNGDTGYTRLNVVSNLTAGGTLSLVFNPPPSPGANLNVLDWGTLSGAFAATNIVGVPTSQVNFGTFYTDGILKFVTASGSIFTIQ